MLGLTPSPVSDVCFFTNQLRFQFKICVQLCISILYVQKSSFENGLSNRFDLFDIVISYHQENLNCLKKYRDISNVSKNTPRSEIPSLSKT